MSPPESRYKRMVRKCRATRKRKFIERCRVLMEETKQARKAARLARKEQPPPTGP